MTTGPRAIPRLPETMWAPKSRLFMSGVPPVVPPVIGRATVPGGRSGRGWGGYRARPSARPGDGVVAAAGALQPHGYRVTGGEPPVVALRDAAEQEDPVVGGQAEGGGEQQDRRGGIQRALAGVAEQPLQTAVLE